VSGKTWPAQAEAIDQHENGAPDARSPRRFCLRCERQLSAKNRGFQDRAVDDGCRAGAMVADVDRVAIVLCAETRPESCRLPLVNDNDSCTAALAVVADAKQPIHGAGPNLLYPSWGKRNHAGLLSIVGARALSAARDGQEADWCQDGGQEKRIGHCQHPATIGRPVLQDCPHATLLSMRFA
jgi:hypothetical protein